MFNLNERGKEETILDELFECREENLCVITETDKKRLKELIKDNDTYQILLANVDALSDDDTIKDKVKDSLDSYIDRVNVIGSYENEKFYKIRICRCNEFSTRLHKTAIISIFLRVWKMEFLKFFHFSYLSLK